MQWKDAAPERDRASFSGLTRETLNGQAWEPLSAGDARVRPEHDGQEALPARKSPSNLTFATVFRFKTPIRFADIAETTSADRAAQAAFMSPEVNARQRDCALGRETAWR